MHRPETSWRMLKWAVELGQFNVDYKPKTTIKAQALADFLLDFPPDEVINGQEVPDEPIGEQVEKENCVPWCILYVDGAVNTNEAGAGMGLVSPEGHQIQSSIHFFFSKMQIMMQSMKHLLQD